MISLLIKDKNGVVVENGDMIKLVSIKPEYQEEFDPFFSFQNALKISVIPACTRFLSLSGSHHAFRLPPAFSEVSPHLL